MCLWINQSIHHFSKENELSRNFNYMTFTKMKISYFDSRLAYSHYKIYIKKPSIFFSLSKLWWWKSELKPYTFSENNKLSQHGKVKLAEWQQLRSIHGIKYNTNKKYEVIEYFHLSSNMKITWLISYLILSILLLIYLHGSKISHILCVYIYIYIVEEDC